MARDKGDREAIHDDRGSVQRREAVALEPVGHDGPQEAELREIALRAGPIAIDAIGADSEVTRFRKAEELTWDLTVKAGQAGSILVTESTDVKGRRERVLKGMGRQSQAELSRAMARWQSDVERKPAR